MADAHTHTSRNTGDKVLQSASNGDDGDTQVAKDATMHPIDALAAWQEVMAPALWPWAWWEQMLGYRVRLVVERAKR